MRVDLHTLLHEVCSVGGYGYEIIGGILIVLSSLVGEQMKPEWKKRFYACFIGIAFAYSGIGISLRREATRREETQRQELKDELTGVRLDLSNVLAAFRGLGPSVASLNVDVARMRRDLEMAKGKHDPQAIAELEAKVKVAQQQVNDAAKGYLVALVPATVSQLKSWRGSWSSPEGEELIVNADYLRRGLLEGMKQTPEDIAAAALFEKVFTENGYGEGGYGGSKSGFTNWDAGRAARYLEALMVRTGIPLPPSGLSVQQNIP